MTIPFEESYHGQLRALVGNRKLILPAARALIINDDGAVLFVRRSDNHEWVMPAGSQELEESIYDCLVREVKEETGLDVQAAQLIAVYSEPRFAFTNAYGGEHQMLAFMFEVTAWTGQLLAETDETLDAQFFALDSLPVNVPHLYHETLADWQAFDGTVILK